MLDLALNVKGAARQRRDGGNRRCIVEGSNLTRGMGIRFVVGPGDVVVPDILAKLPGRGIWVGARRPLIDRAVSNNRFSRAARRRVAAPDNLSDRVEAHLLDRCVDLIALARRAGQAVAGFEKTRARLSQGETSILLQAFDASENAQNKIKALSRGVTVVRVLHAVELGRAFGRAQVVHAALTGGGLAERLYVEIKRLNGFRAEGGDWD